MTTPLRVLISADMEGVAGVVHPTETNPERYDYERGRRLMTAEVNAVIAGVLDAVPEAAVRVADAHGTFRNILPEELDRRVRLVRGRPRPLGMLGGLDDNTGAVLFVGYHARAGAGPAVLAHTISDAVLDLRINGQSMGEIGLNTALAGHHGAPVVLLGGDDAACAELNALVPAAVTVPVKVALGQAAGETLHPEEARERLRAAATTAIENRGQVPPLTLTGPLAVEVDLYAPATVDLATLIPGVSRAPGARTVTFTANNTSEAHSLIQLLTHLAQIKPA
ncbi:M55 family metallopeptidase [Micromonospora sp. NBC_01796]|uniref:M55 family metallopeptidase n=1 Tax=Micromonospora sp. NBC_01796 TaxID=2975987 RepID=UPI002DD7EBB6|nr:M55 family metallopeptidase [Micromonospora sp. NBC_01796]WSA83418.1 M55 family metallopeptidase [Micromonospora sp. NBC_01796]